MNTPSYKFKKMICALDRNERYKVLEPIKLWLIEQFQADPNARDCHGAIETLYSINSWAENKVFKDHYVWAMLSNQDSCKSFQEIVKAKGVPIKNIAVAIKDANSTPRKAIPKKIRGEVWKIQFGDSTKGRCFCCKAEMDIFDIWHAGHMLSRSNGGTDTVDNLRAVCGSCNLSMGTENMNDFKARCYPEATPPAPVCTEANASRPIAPEEEAVFWSPGLLLSTFPPKYLKWKLGTNSIQMIAETKGRYTYNSEKGIYIRNF